MTASQFINRQLALDSGVPDEQIALGDAFEIDTPVVNSLLLRVGAGAADARAVPGVPGQVHAADAPHGRQPVPHARHRLAVQPRDDRHRPGHPDDRRADRGDLHAARARPRDRPGKRQLRVQRRARPRRGDRVQAGRDRPDARAGGARRSARAARADRRASACSRRSARASSATCRARSTRAAARRASSRSTRAT